MVPGRILIMAAILGAAAASAEASEVRRLWTDPPPGAVSAAAPEASPPAVWPDEAERRPRPASPSADIVASTATAAVATSPAREEPAAAVPVATPDPLRDGAPAAQPAPARSVQRPAVSDRARRRLGVLAGFAGAAAAPSAHAAPAGVPEEASGRSSQQVRGALGRVRILQIRRGRVVVVYTRS
jgi:hypothetical protein